MTGLHHVTALCGDAQRNHDFYVGVLGLRLVKATINYDHPEGWHLYYGDAAGSPGTLITFFPGYAPGSAGLGQAGAVSFAVPSGSLDAWAARFAEHDVSFFGPEEVFDQGVLHFVDPDDMPLELVEAGPGEGGTAISGLLSATLFSRDPGQTFGFLRDLFDARQLDSEDDRHRLSVGGSLVDLVVRHGGAVGRPGAGTFHHVAWRVEDQAELERMAARVAETGLHVTEIKDRTYFKSVYFREPGGILFELATDGPGFGVNESELGSRLCLPDDLEVRRDELAAGLPRIKLVSGSILP